MFGARAAQGSKGQRSKGPRFIYLIRAHLTGVVNNIETGIVAVCCVMAEDASHQLARQVVARLCQPLGWQGIQNGACDVLADLMKRYIVTLGKNAAAYVANGKSPTC